MKGRIGSGIRPWSYPESACAHDYSRGLPVFSREVRLGASLDPDIEVAMSSMRSWSAGTTTTEQQAL